MDWKALLKNEKLDVALLIIVELIWVPASWLGLLSHMIFGFAPALGIYPSNLFVDFIMMIVMPILLAVCCLWEEISEL